MQYVPSPILNPADSQVVQSIQALEKYNGFTYGPVVGAPTQGILFEYDDNGATSFLSQNATSGTPNFFFDDGNYSAICTMFGGPNKYMIVDGSIGSYVSASITPATLIVLNTVWYNPLPTDITILVTLLITANTSLVVTAGVGPGGGAAPTVFQTLITGTTLTGIVPLSFRICGNAAFVINTSGVGTVSIMGQMQMNN